MSTTKKKTAGRPPGRPPGKKPVKALSMATRIDRDTLASLDQAGAELERRHGFPFTRAAVIRLMVQRGLNCNCKAKER